MDMKRIGKKLKQARLKAGLTQETVAGNRMAVRTLQRLEDGDGNPTLSTLEDLAKALGTTVTDLLHDETDSQNIHTLYQPAPALGRLSDEEGFRIFRALDAASEGRRLAALYLLTRDESYYLKALELADAAPVVRVLKKVLAT
jgi:transcriptional regulator with XRE-family HTH domain